MRLHEITEGLDSNQRRAGQVGAEERASKVSPVLGKKDKQHPYKGRLVGENEAVDEASLATMRDYFAGNKDAQDELEITKQRKYYQELKKREEEELRKKAALQGRSVTKIGGSIKEFAPAGGEGGDNYGGDLHDILMAYISANEPGLLKHFGQDVVDGVVSNMVVMRTFDDIDPNNEDDLDNALDQIIEILNDEQGVTEASDEKIADRYSQDEWDEKMRRLKKLAGQGPLKTVWDPVKRVYKNVPVNQKSEDK